MLDNAREMKMSTPYGPPSGPITLGTFKGREMVFIPRHGPGHTIPPHRVNYRANIWAMKELGVERIFSISAVGSLKEEYRPGQLVLVDQFIDFTKKREYSFFEGTQVVHVSTAEPFCPHLRGLLKRTAESLGMDVHAGGTLVCVEGPRFSTKAESRMFRGFADIIGMTVVPEAPLAREAAICYSTIAMVTDYDVWKEKPVDIEEVIRNMTANISHVRDLLKAAIPKLPEKRDCPCKDALANARI